MKEILRIFLPAIFAIAVYSCSDNDTEPIDQIETPDGYVLVWNDEFNDGQIDLTKWTFETGDGTDFGLPSGWGNNELQIYTTNDVNARVDQDGDVSALIINAVKNGENDYTSAKLTTNGLFSMRFGRIDVRAKLPKGQGIWPAIWTLGDNLDVVDWPGSGEIDIMEMLGHEPTKIYGTIHYVDGDNRKGESQGYYEVSGPDFSETYHVFSLEWTPETLTFMVNDVKYHEVAIEDDMKEFLRSHYLILNVAVGGYWPGYPDESTTFPQSMHVDYVRVFEKEGFNPPLPPVLNIEEETLGQNLEPGIAQHAIKEGFEDLGNIEVISFGGGGEPIIDTSDNAVDGDLSLVFDFPGGAWGGAYFEMEQPRNLSNYSHLVFALNKPENIVDAEVKLESPSTNAAVFLINYESTELYNGFVEYAIPLSDFSGLDLIQLRIPFAIWNPVDANGDFIAATFLIDNLHFANR
ncbi:MAG: glycoside hydrolase family 16 protein [Bacteroidales bacterium]|nr:glycoside hydrolase family 16 protein [Bacteroidales bacterium]